MKDYKQYSKAYKPEEWEEDKEWIARRLEFLWTFCDYYPRLYSDRHLGNEKEEIYRCYGSDNEVSRMANDFHCGQYENQYKFNVEDRCELFREFENLINIKNGSMDKFLRKRIYIKYYYLEEFIHEYLDEEYNEYLIYK